MAEWFGGALKHTREIDPRVQSPSTSIPSSFIHHPSSTIKLKFMLKISTAPNDGRLFKQRISVHCQPFGVKLGVSIEEELTSAHSRNRKRTQWKIRFSRIPNRIDTQKFNTAVHCTLPNIPHMNLPNITPSTTYTLIAFLMNTRWGEWETKKTASTKYIPLPRKLNQNPVFSENAI